MPRDNAFAGFGLKVFSGLARDLAALPDIYPVISRVKSVAGNFNGFVKLGQKNFPERQLNSAHSVCRIFLLENSPQCGDNIVSSWYMQTASRLHFKGYGQIVPTL